VNQVEHEPFARDDARLDPLRRPGKRHHGVRLPRQQFAGDGDPRIQVAAGATAGKHDM
jgi:hypothetical protein